MLFKTLKLEAKTRWPAYSWPHTRPHRLRKGEVYETTEGEGRRNEGGMAVSEPRGIPGDPVRAMEEAKSLHSYRRTVGPLVSLIWFLLLVHHGILEGE